MTVTIKDVAREAQVSVATVSRALNGQGNVAEAVRHRVQGVADRAVNVEQFAGKGQRGGKSQRGQCG